MRKLGCTLRQHWSTHDFQVSDASPCLPDYNSSRVTYLTSPQSTMWFHISSNGLDHLNLPFADAELCSTRASEEPPEASSPSPDMPQDPGMLHVIPSILQDVKTFEQKKQKKHVTFNFKLHSFILKKRILPWCRHPWDVIPALCFGWMRALRARIGDELTLRAAKGKDSQTAQVALRIKKKKKSYSCRTGSLLELGIV